MKMYKRKPDAIQAYRYTGDVQQLKKELGAAFVKEEAKPSDPTDVAVFVWDQESHKWELITSGVYVMRTESGAYKMTTPLWFEENYEEVDLTPSYPSIITYPPGVRGARDYQ